MKHPLLKFYIFSLLGISLLLSSCKNDKAEGELNLLIYNVAGLLEGISSSSPALYTPHISPLLNEYNIVHVQEDFCYHHLLIQENEHEYVTDPTPCTPFGDGLNTFSDFPIKGLDRKAWTNCDAEDCLTPKGFSFSTITIEGIDIDFYNIHCQSGSSNSAQTARRKNLYQIINYMNNKSTGNPVVVMGDFNNRYTREGDTIRIMQDNGFTDAWVELIREGDIPNYGISLKDCEETGTNINCEGVDKFFYRSNDKITLSALSFQYGDDERFYYNGDENQPLSDHKPMFVTLNYKEE